MSDENKTPETEQPVQGNEEALNDELNNLRDIFQQELQKTIEESEEEPVIQELDEDGEIDDEADDNSDDESDQSNNSDSKKKKKKKAKKEEKKRSRIPLVILIIVLIILIIPLLAYFIFSVTVPNFTTLISAYSVALSAETDEQKLAAYEDVASLCEEDGAPEWFAQTIYEEIVVLKCKTEGYAAALQYMQKNMTEEMTSNAKSKEFKDFMKIGDTVNRVAENAFDKTAEALQTAGSPSEMDFEALASDIGAHDLIKKDVASALTYIAEGMALEKIADTEELFMDAVTDYLRAAYLFSSLGADTDVMYENIAVNVYNAGYLYETIYIINNYLDEEQLSSPKTDEFSSLLKDIDALKTLDIDVYSVALSCYENGTLADADIKNAIKANLPDSVKGAIANIAKTIIEGIEGENEKNLTKAGNRYSQALTTLEAIELDAAPLAMRLISIYLQNGDTQSANSLKEAYITDELLENQSEEYRAMIDELTKLYSAQYTVNEAFLPFYSDAYYNGGQLDKEAVNAALDELLTDEADEYILAFVSYYKYLAEGFTDENTDIMLKHLLDFAEKMENYPVLYGISLAEVYRMSGDYEKAEEVAKEILEINIADDYSNSLIAFVNRINGNTDEALKAAEKGMALSDDSYYCPFEAIIDLILIEDYEKAFDYAKSIYDPSNPTRDICEYIKIIAALYSGDNEELTDELESYAAEIDNLFETYGVPLSDNTQKIINGTLTPYDVFMTAPYALFE